MVRLLQILANKYKTPFIWKYFATGHGKGIIDGIGGNAKRLVREKVMAKGEKEQIVQCAQDFSSLATILMPSTKVMHVAEEEIKSIVQKYNPWADVQPVVGISSYHVIEVNENGDFKFQKNAMSPIIKHAGKTWNITLSVGDWCLVKYDNLTYPGEVTDIDIDECEVEVSVMLKAGTMYKWPKCPDVLRYSKDQVIRNISPPVKANNRGYFKFPDL